MPLIYREMSAPGERKLIAREGERLRAYQDQRGIWTDGIGHSSLAGDGAKVGPGTVITQAQAEAQLLQDLRPREKLLNSWLKRQATQNQFDAMDSLMFNVGDGAFKGSAVLHLFNLGDIHGAAAAFMHFDHPISLTGRREDEMKQFLS